MPSKELQVVYTGTKTLKNLNNGSLYQAKIDGSDTFRVKDDSGKWNKYSMKHFKDTDGKRVSKTSFQGGQHVQRPQRVGGQVQPPHQTATQIMTKVHKETLKEVVVITSADGTRVRAKVEDVRAYVDSLPVKKQQKFVKNQTDNQLKILAHKFAMVGAVSPHRIMQAEIRRRKNVGETKPEKKEERGATMAQKKKVTIRDFLKSQGIGDDMVKGIAEFRKEHKLDETVKERLVVPHTLYQGSEVWCQAIAAILEGQNILLEGAKATGKNVLAQNLAFIFGRPQWDISFHVHIDASSLIGSETFKGGEVVFKPGAVHQVATFGGFGVLDEINMAKSEAVAVLHAILDDRKVIDVPGYDRIHLNDATRFIGTMNYGYAGTRELNEALVSRFVVIDVPSLSDAGLVDLLHGKYPDADKGMLEHFGGVFTDLQKKAQQAEISTKAVDLRGILSALALIRRGLQPHTAMECSVVNKAFDAYERDIVRDTVETRISKSWTPNVIFPSGSELAIDFSSVR